MPGGRHLGSALAADGSGVEASHRHGADLVQQECKLSR